MERNLDKIIYTLREDLEVTIVPLGGKTYRVSGCITGYVDELMTEQDIRDEYHFFYEE